ncbi:hypothetical protein [Streptomyces griseorubiginosus]|uniref:hypothetical protein n=1 Tax=Streptomyces griseorubiginosus TaxID=67304 RepID=UPI0036E4CE68
MTIREPALHRRMVGSQAAIVAETADGIVKVDENEVRDFSVPGHGQAALTLSLDAREIVSGYVLMLDGPCPEWIVTERLNDLAKYCLVLPRSERWRQALSTALLGTWADPLAAGALLAPTALGTLKNEARTLHRQLVPLWRRRTRHGRVLSLNADLGGVSLYDLVADEVDFLAHTARGVFEDERLNRVLRGLDPAERAVVFAYAEGEGTTWTEAATVAGAPEPQAFGERVRRKVHRLAAEQRRRAAQHRPGPPEA